MLESLITRPLLSLASSKESKGDERGRTEGHLGATENPSLDSNYKSSAQCETQKRPTEIIKRKIAIVLLNLGGPSSLRKVKQFLFNLFYDKAIINLPNPIRFIFAKLISVIREKKSQHLYSLIGGKSPILQETELQRLAIIAKLKQILNEDFDIFITMRYSSPGSKEVVKSIMKYNPSEIILLPLYPQFSTATTKSSVEDIMSSLAKNKLTHIPVKTICCYPTDSEFIAAHSSIIKQSIENLKNKEKYRILFSAHSLPEKIIKSGDPYQWQVEKTVEKILFQVKIDDLDYKIVYQSKIGPVKWLGPSTEDEIEKAGKENKSLIIVPIAFVSEHVETLVELDIEYINIANKYGIEYVRVPALGVNKLFIDSLTKMILRLVKQEWSKDINHLIVSSVNKKLCLSHFTMCLCNYKN